MENKYLLILFYSAGGSVRNIAHAIADGAEQENLSVKIRTVPKVSSVAEQTEKSIPKKDEIYCTKEDLINLRTSLSDGELPSDIFQLGLMNCALYLGQ